MKKILAIILLIPSLLVAATDVNILPMGGPAGTFKISPPNGSSVAYRMDFPAQKTITFINATDVEVYIGTFSAITNANGFPLFSKGTNISMDLSSGTTLYFYGNGVSADIRAIFSR